MKPVPHYILAISTAVGILLLSVTLPTEKPSDGQKNPPASSLTERLGTEAQGHPADPGTTGAQFPFLLME
ncbi:MAG: hypothetical protein ACKOA4_09535 [Haliscomenobacter sp.]